MILPVILAISAIVSLVIFGVQQKKKLAEIDRLNNELYQKSVEEERKLKQDYEATLAAIAQYLPGIVCWGDSLTYGAMGNGTSYPKVLSDIISGELAFRDDRYSISIPVKNMGVGGETSITICGRNGSIPFVISEEFTIPSGKTKVEIKIKSQSGRGVNPLRQGNAGVNNVTIAGIEGTLSVEQSSYTSSDCKYYFTRVNNGDSKRVAVGTQIITDASSKYLDYVTVIFMGTNGGYSDINELISQQRAIINHQTANKDRFIIVGLHTGTAASRAELEAAMVATWGDKYINLREYMVTQALADAGITPTAEDLELIAKGSTPASVRAPGGDIHFNATGYELIGKLIYNRMDSLGYFNEVKAALGK